MWFCSLSFGKASLIWPLKVVQFEELAVEPSASDKYRIGLVVKILQAKRSSIKAASMKSEFFSRIRENYAQPSKVKPLRAHTPKLVQVVRKHRTQNFRVYKTRRNFFTTFLPRFPNQLKRDVFCQYLNHFS